MSVLGLELAHLLLAVKLAARVTPLLPGSLFLGPVGESMLPTLRELLGRGNARGWSSWRWEREREREREREEGEKGREGAEGGGRERERER